MILLLSKDIAMVKFSVFVLFNRPTTITEVIFIFNCDYPKMIILQTESFRICDKHENKKVI